MSRGWDEGSAALGEEPWRVLRPGGNWDDLVLPAALVARLRQVPELYRQQMEKDGRASLLFLFGGPSGVGKTSAALALAGELGRSVTEADVDELIRRDPTHAPHLVARLLQRARQLGGVLVLDHADSLLRPRREGIASDLNERAALPLLQLDRDESRLPGVVILCAELVHPGEHVRLRFDDTFIFPALDAGARSRIWRRHLPAGHLIPSAEIAYLGQSFRLSAKDIAGCCATADRRTVGRAVTLHDIADRLDAEYQNRVTSDWTRAALDEVRVRAARLALSGSTYSTHGPNTWASSAPGPPPRTSPAREPAAARWVPASRPRARAAAEPAPPRPARPTAYPRRRPTLRAFPALARRPRRDVLTLLGIVLTGAIAAVALGLALSHHTKAQPTALNSPAISQPSTTGITYRAGLAQALGVLNQARTRLSRQLDSAHTPAAQSQAADALASAHLKAASTLLRLDAGPAATANQSLAAALQKTGDAYSTLAQAARVHDASGYKAAQAAVGQANASLSKAIAQVRRIAG